MCELKVETDSAEHCDGGNCTNRAEQISPVGPLK
ncbi:hypothetical protein SBC1_77910 (plasmid) [Caballeronia sp. SBC1]|nr:hypothetical protein SBC2_81130 [Caballeronia sp. SBC2]QIN67744.1 hypothetical protein SBC1_77910 [Caballeronia sp. SBC1]